MPFPQGLAAARGLMSGDIAAAFALLMTTSATPDSQTGSAPRNWQQVCNGLWMSSQSAAPVTSEDSLEGVSGCSTFGGGNECHRTLLWHEIWEYLIHECRERAARHGREEDPATNVEHVISTVRPAHIDSGRVSDTG